MENQFSKKDLRTGMQVELRDGARFVVLLDFRYKDEIYNKDIIINVDERRWNSLDLYNEDLLYTYHDKGDIMKVYRPSVFCDCIHKHIDDDDLIWEREKKIEITITVNGKRVSPDTISRETWDNLRKEVNNG